ncbi:hypothetical protein GCM10027031_04740 [Corynebacterium atrinae]
MRQSQGPEYGLKGTKADSKRDEKCRFGQGIHIEELGRQQEGEAGNEDQGLNQRYPAVIVSVIHLVARIFRIKSQCDDEKRQSYCTVAVVLPENRMGKSG